MLTQRGRQTALLGFAVGSALCAGCQATPPAGWLPGGARLTLTDAVWRRTQGEDVKLTADGRVLEGGSAVFSVDVVGRVVDAANEPVALLTADGTLLGPDNVSLGSLGEQESSPPLRGSAWLRLTRDGQVVHVKDDGQSVWDGHWEDCRGPAVRTCLLVTHLVRVRGFQRSARGDSTAVDVSLDD